ncbi:MAG: XRE family transcriptional regulator [Terracidiphilus sp.]|jgi:transcriptional regulator with XRE-family HTH domain
MAIKWNDLKHKSSPEIRANLKREADTELERIGIHKLRQARQQTQVAIAERLNIAQGAVSRMEKQSDFLLSTLREYVGALGGQLELRVVFPDRDFVIETLAPATSTKKRPSRVRPASGGLWPRHDDAISGSCHHHSPALFGDRSRIPSEVTERQLNADHRLVEAIAPLAQQLVAFGHSFPSSLTGMRSRSVPFHVR